MKATIRSIASMCGVSRGTVDRVLNNRAYVKPEVRERVLRAIKQTGYQHPGTPPATACGVRIGFLIAHWEDDYFRRQTEQGIRKAQRIFRPGELDLVLARMDSRSDEEYIRRLEAFVTDGVRGIILNAADNILLRRMIDDLAARNIPTVTYNSDLPTSRRICHVGQDLLKSGEIAAGLLARVLPPRGHVLAVTGNMEFLAHRTRIDGFFKRMKELGFTYDQLELAECFEQYDLTYDTVLNMLRRDAAIRGIYMGTESVPACIAAVGKAQRKLHIVVNDLTPSSTRFLKNNELDFVIEQDFSAQAYEAILVLYNLLAHGRIPKKAVHHIKTSIFTQELL